MPIKHFGCTVFVHNTDQNRSKLDPRAKKCVFVGYAPTKKGYKCYDPISKKLFVSMDVTFFETQPFFKSPLQGEKNSEDPTWDKIEQLVTEVPFQPEQNLISESGSKQSPTNSVLTQNQEDQSLVPAENNGPLEGDANKKKFRLIYSRKNLTHGRESEIFQQSRNSNPRQDQNLVNAPSPVQDYPGISPPLNSIPGETTLNNLPIVVRNGVRSCTKYPMSKFVSYEKLSQMFSSFTTQLSLVEIPNNVQDALQVPEWKEAVLEEMRALEKNNTWKMVDLPKDKKTVGCKCVFTVKYKLDGSLEKYKARLVAKGFTQTYGIDYTETFAPGRKT